jgi:crossover junction endodeoxyribonuclease RuvC
MTTILGIDPGVATVGFGVITSSGSKQEFVRCGVISTPAGQKLSLRLQQIYHDMLELIDLFQPDVISVEELFFNNNITTGISVAHGRGVAILAGQEKGIPMFEYTPLQVKKAITGYGRANKKQMMEMVKRLLNLEEVARPDDASDALALAICHARFSSSLLNIDGGDNICSTI